MVGPTQSLTGMWLCCDCDEDHLNSYQHSLQCRRLSWILTRLAMTRCHLGVFAEKAMVRGTNAVINCILMAVLVVSYGIGVSDFDVRNIRTGG